MKKILLLIILFCSSNLYSQKIDSIYFNLYTDSLKKGVYNYINVDGLLKNGTFLPLMDNEIIFTSSCGKWKGNCLIIDSAVNAEKVLITATLKSNQSIKKEVEIYLKKNNTDPVLMEEKDIIEMYRKGKKKP